MSAVRLSTLEAEIWPVRYGDQTFQMLSFLCPLPGCNHSNGMAFHDGNLVRIPREDGTGDHLIWKRVSGSTIDDLTLSPSYHLTSRRVDAAGVEHKIETCGLHGHVVNGYWVPC